MTKLIFFILGNILLIGGIFASFFFLPKFDSDLEKLRSEIQENDANFRDKLFQFSEYKTDSALFQQLKTIKTLIANIELPIKNQYIYEELDKHLKEIDYGLLTILGTASETMQSGNKEFLPKWSQMSFDQLAEEEKNYSIRLQEEFQHIFDQKMDYQVKEKNKSKERQTLIIWSGLSQVLGMLSLFWDAFYERRREKVEVCLFKAPKIRKQGKV